MQTLYRNLMFYKFKHFKGKWLYNFDQRNKSISSLARGKLQNKITKLTSHIISHLQIYFAKRHTWNSIHFTYKITTPFPKTSFTIQLGERTYNCQHMLHFVMILLYFNFGWLLYYSSIFFASLLYLFNRWNLSKIHRYLYSTMSKHCAIINKAFKSLKKR
jgi:hypothetical protein